ncbi:MAG: hypothetical protein ACLVJ6_06585 [Merdibacter sp.]
MSGLRSSKSSFMFPVGLLYRLVADLMNGGIPDEDGASIGGCAVCVGSLADHIPSVQRDIFCHPESGVRRITLAERLQKYRYRSSAKRSGRPHQYDHGRLYVLEQSFSHFIPELAGSILYDPDLRSAGDGWRMATAALWVLPLSCHRRFSSRYRNA